LPRPFLSARWSNVCLVSYALAPERLAARVPAGVELLTRDGAAFVSLVAFDFHDTRVLGVPWPGFGDFPEVNLRFYVQRAGEPGVVFLRELVPRRLVAWLARTVYNEPYERAPMASAVDEDEATITATHTVGRGGAAQRLSVTGAKPAFRPAPDSTAHFFKEHHWGFGVDAAGRTRRYLVEHPTWDVYPVTRWDLAWDWGATYGPEWADLARAEPVSVVLAVGSPIRVFPAALLGEDAP